MIFTMLCNQCYCQKMDLSLSCLRQLVVLLVFSSRFITINMKGPNKYILKSNQGRKYDCKKKICDTLVFLAKFKNTGIYFKQILFMDSNNISQLIRQINKFHIEPLLLIILKEIYRKNFRFNEYICEHTYMYCRCTGWHVFPQTNDIFFITSSRF